MTTTWILVANATSALLWKSRGTGHDLELERRFEHPEGRLKNLDLASDAGGRNATPDGQGSRPGTQWSTSPREVESEKFARELVHELSAGLSARKYDRLLLAASPDFMGKIRESLDNRLQEKVAATVVRDYTILTARELREKLASVLLV
ncbi:MAG: host attachment protein [Nitrospirae bacterium]|nr:MAG: hypothetical protein D084_Lepto4C00415G0006 [Leptospirillum sp. Group IV 'UBA BS']MCL4485777.1 host attachment protein [Nitrospirota bacterium]MCL5285206.1 host attachment protein [Nitrospirota bacterium]